jgi:hypothetical protein
MQLMVMTCDSVLLGIVGQYLNLGFADEKALYTTIEGAAFRGLLEGCACYLINRNGAAVTIGTGMVSKAVQNMLVAGAGLTLSKTETTTVLIQKSVQTAVYYAIDESGGIGNLTKTLITKTVQAVNQRWWRPFKKYWVDTVDKIADWVIETPRGRIGF